MPHWGATKSRALRSLSRPDGRSRPREFASLIRCGSGGVPRWGPRIRAAQWGGREIDGRPVRADCWGGRGRPIRPAPCAWYLSFLRLFFPAGAGRCAPRSGRKAGSFGWFRVFRATAQLGPWWVGGSVGAFPGGPAGRWRVSFAQPAVVRAGVRPLPLSGCWAVSLSSALPLGCRPARYLNFLPAGVPVCFCVLGPGVGFCLARSALLPAPNGARGCVVGGGGGRRPPGAGAFCINGIQSANTSLQKDGVHSPQRKPGRNQFRAGGWIPAHRRERPRRGHLPPVLGLIPCASSFAIDSLSPYRKSDRTANTPALGSGRKGTKARKG